MFFKKKLLAASAAASAALVTSPVFAEGGDPFSAVEQGAQDATNSLSNVSLVVGVLSLVVAGLALMSTRKMREWAKEHIGWVIVGLATIAIASSFVPYIFNLFKG